jgi:ubiquinone/menaquinone biosynthesis C-methylase UbiE
MNDEHVMRDRIQRSAFSVYRSVVRWAFARFYREFAWAYDTVAVAVSGGRWFAWGHAALPYLAGDVLELGCGTGHLQRALARAVGVDASPQMLAITRRRLAKDDLPMRLVRSIAQALPFSTASFDCVAATFPSEYIADPATLAEVRRVLRPGGRLVVVLAAAFAEDGLYQRVVDLLYRVTLQRSPRAPLSQEQTPRASALRSPLAGRIAEQGYAVAERWEKAAGSQVLLLLAEPV